MKNKNIFLISTDKESNLYKCKNGLFTTKEYFKHSVESQRENQFIYITNDEKPNEGDWCVSTDKNFIIKLVNAPAFECDKKIVLTNDTSLIKDGVQQAPSVFLSFYAENKPDYVEVEKWLDDEAKRFYTLNFPQKETENKKNWIFERSSGYAGYRNTENNKWIYESEYLEKFAEKEIETEEKLYTKEDLEKAFSAGLKRGHSGYPNTDNWTQLNFEEWFNTIKKHKQLNIY